MGNNMKYLIMDCPECSQELRRGILCIGTPVNEVHILFEMSQTDFHCDDCGITVAIGDIDYEIF